MPFFGDLINERYSYKCESENSCIIAIRNAMDLETLYPRLTLVNLY